MYQQQPPIAPPPMAFAPPYYPPPPAPPRRRAFVLLIIAAVVLAAAVAVTAVLGWSSVADQRRGVADRKAELDRIAQQEQAATSKQESDFRAADLATLLQRVKTLDIAADSALGRWRSGTTKFGELNTAMNDCDDAVIAYDRAAAPFPDRLFTTLPKRIDLDNQETDCGRSFTASI
ncbi:hypothetical protein [Dactylosporangium sp. NPDC051541]|uniref:hypothetical protein n=1 Tax=Dactylosporangium sp. NPDC051541 TaxID=3363977 RepID=UPI0037BE1BCB